MTCKRLKEYSVQPLASDYVEHVSHCADCAREIQKIKTIENETRQVAEADNLALSGPSESVKQFLITQPTARVRPAVLHWAIASSAAVILLSVLIWHLFIDTWSETSDSSVTPNSIVAQLFTQDGGVRSVPTQSQLTAPKDGRLLVRLPSDQFGLGSGGALEVEEAQAEKVTLRLNKGTLACQVKRRSPQGHFTVHYGEFSVRVVGTRFLVSSDTQALLRVSVVTGKVEVRGPGGFLSSVSASESLTIFNDKRTVRESLHTDAGARIDQLLSTAAFKWTDEKVLAPKSQAPGSLPSIHKEDDIDNSRQNRTKPTLAKVDGLPDWQQLVLAGELAKAEKKLTEHLKQTPLDVDAWWLLATCRRKAGDWQGAVAAYDRVIKSGESGSRARQDQARFRAAKILQEKLQNHRSALAYLEQYLSNSSAGTPLRAEAMTRQAESLAAMGDKAHARQVLEQVVTQYGDSPSSEKAKQLLQKY